MRRNMHYLVVMFVIGVSAAAFFGFGVRSAKSGKYSTAEIQRGKYLVSTAGGCNDCHTPHVLTSGGLVNDSTRLLSGAPSDEKVPVIPDGIIGSEGWSMLQSNDETTFAGPWGVSFAANLTPDKATGIGSWTEKMFIECLHDGKYWATGRELLPPMPWEEMGKMSDNDLRDIYAYLMSIKPVSNVVPSPVPPKQQ